MAPRPPVVSPAARPSVVDVPDLPALSDYLGSLDVVERTAAMNRMAAMSDVELRSLGVSEPQHNEYDYDVEVTGEMPADLPSIT